MSLGEPLYSGFDMIVDSCTAGDTKGHFETLIGNSEVFDGLDGIVRISQELVPRVNEANANFAFDFSGFTRKGSNECKSLQPSAINSLLTSVQIACTVTIVPIDTTPSNPIEVTNPPEEPEEPEDPESVPEYQFVFAYLDTDANDYLSVEEFFTGVNAFNPEFTMANATMAVQYSDTDGDEKLSIDEFETLYEKEDEEEEEENQ